MGPRVTGPHQSPLVVIPDGITDPPLRGLTVSVVAGNFLLVKSDTRPLLQMIWYFSAAYEMKTSVEHVSVEETRSSFKPPWNFDALADSSHPCIAPFFPACAAVLGKRARFPNCRLPKDAFCIEAGNEATNSKTGASSIKLPGR